MSRIEELRQQISEHPQWVSAQGWYLALPERDRLVVKSVASLLVAALIFVLVFAPLMRTNQTLQAGLEKRLAVYELIADNEGRFGGVSSVSASSTSGPLLSRVTQSARRSGIKLDRYEQDGKGVRIWLDKVKFDQFIGWVESLGSQHHIYVSQISLDRDDAAGWADVRATLVSG